MDPHLGKFYLCYDSRGTHGGVLLMMNAMWPWWNLGVSQRSMPPWRHKPITPPSSANHTAVTRRNLPVGGDYFG